MASRLAFRACSALAMSVPNSKLPDTTARKPLDTDCTESIPSMPSIAVSIGAVASRTTASGPAER